MTSTTISVNKVSIRLTDERWRHIVENRDELAGYYYDVLEVVAEPDYILEGNLDELWAVRFHSDNKAMVVIYKEEARKKDGFIITAFLTSKIRKLLNRKKIWEKQR